MARKVERKDTVSRPEEGRDDVSVMHPDINLTIADREITVREYGFVEGLSVRRYMKPFTDALEQSFGRGEAMLDDIIDLVAEHWEIVQRAIAASAQVETAWIAGLDDRSGDLLMQAWWNACGPFFIRRIVRKAVERIEAARLTRPAGPTSTSSSSVPASAIPSASVGTPSDRSASSMSG